MKFFELKKLNRTASHEDNRKRCCMLCLRRPKRFVDIKNDIEKKIKEFLKFNITDDKLPSIICSYCYTKLYSKSKEDENSRAVKIPFPDYSKFRLNLIETRSGGILSSVDGVKKCDAYKHCRLCFIVNDAVNLFTRNFNGQKITCTHAAPGSGPSIGNQRQLRPRVSNSASILNLRKNPKKYRVGEHLSNIKSKLTTNLNEKEVEQLAALLVKSTMTSNNKDVRKDGVSLRQLRGKPLRLSLNQKPDLEQSKFSAEDFDGLRVKYNFSQNVARNLATDIRKITKKRISLNQTSEKNCKRQLTNLMSIFSQSIYISLKRTREKKKWLRKP